MIEIKRIIFHNILLPSYCCQTASEHPSYHFLQFVSKQKDYHNTWEEFDFPKFHKTCLNHIHPVREQKCLYNQLEERQIRYFRDL